MTLSQHATIKNVVTVGAGEASADSADYIAYFSSNGPTYDGRIKPDIIAPGQSVTSASSNGDGGPSCNTVSKQGTSMASPGAAGTAALIFDYFQNSKFWVTTCNQLYSFCKKFTPSDVLVKAAILHSGVSMSMYHFGDASQDVKLGLTPDIYQGYGRIQLSNVLPMRGLYDFDLFVSDL